VFRIEFVPTLDAGGGLIVSRGWRSAVAFVERFEFGSFVRRQPDNHPVPPAIRKIPAREMSVAAVDSGDICG